MSIFVVGGHSREVGKTSVVAGIIRAMPEHRWLAVKITQFGHGICSADGEPCECEITDHHNYAVTEERSRDNDTDTSRFLVAGAERVLWVRTRQGKLAEAMPRLRKEMANSENVILESNSVIRFLKPTLYVVVLDPSCGDFKLSTRTFLDRADAVLMRKVEAAPQWKDVSLKPVQGVPVFDFTPPHYVTGEFLGFLRRHTNP